MQVDANLDEGMEVFKPTSAYKTMLKFLLIVVLLLSTVGLILASGYFIFCLLDKKAPIEITKFEATDTYLGGTFSTIMVGQRLRQCEIVVYHQAIDSRGNVVYERTFDRPFNGLAGKKIETKYPDIPLNSRAKTPGDAKMFVYFQWKCPYNIVHKYIHPLELIISADFKIYPDKASYDEAMKNKAAKNDKSNSGSNP